MRGIIGSRIIVAGGATGVGAAVARRLGQEGAHIIIGDINIKGAESVAEEITSAAQNGAKAAAFEFTLAEEQSINALIQKCADEYGGVDGLVNIGAALGPDVFGKDKDIQEMDPQIWNKTFDVNLTGYALTTKAVIPYFLRNANGGSIVNISSGAAWSGTPGIPAYQISKAGLHALTRYMAVNYGPRRIRTNCVAFGAIASEKLKTTVSEEDRKQMEANSALKRIAEPEEPAALVVYLLSDDSSYVNGQVWSCCGGAYLRE